MTAKEFMFGYESDLVNIGHKFLPSWISFDKVGLIDRVIYYRIKTSIINTKIIIKLDVRY